MSLTPNDADPLNQRWTMMDLEPKNAEARAEYEAYAAAAARAWAAGDRAAIDRMNDTEDDPGDFWLSPWALYALTDGFYGWAYPSTQEEDHEDLPYLPPGAKAREEGLIAIIRDTGVRLLVDEYLATHGTTATALLRTAQSWMHGDTTVGGGGTPSFDDLYLTILLRARPEATEDLSAVPLEYRQWLARTTFAQLSFRAADDAAQAQQDAEARAMEAERQRADEERRRLAVEEENARLQRWQKDGVPPFTRYPLMALNNMVGGPQWRSSQLTLLDELERADKLDSVPEPRQLDTWRGTLTADVNPVHWGLSVPEWRLLHGVYALYAASGTNGDRYGDECVPEDWGRLYLLAGIPEFTDQHGRRRRSPTRTKELKEAAERLTKREVPVFISLRKPNGRYATSAPTVTVLKRIPVWDDLSAAENAALQEKPPEAWPAPSRFMLQLPGALRTGLARYFREVPTDLWDRLERAADGKHTDNAFRLALKLYQLPPSDQERGPGCVRLSRATLADSVPALAGYARGRKWTRFDQTVLDAAGVLHRAGLLAMPGGWERGKTGDPIFCCERDVAVFPGLKRSFGPLAHTVSGAGTTVSGAGSTVSGARATVPGAQPSRKRKQD